MPCNEGPRWIKHWEFKFLRGIYHAQHEYDVEQAQRGEQNETLDTQMARAGRDLGSATSD
jgi:hypothetical protein